MSPTLRLDMQNLDAAGKRFESPLSADWLRDALAGCDLEPAGPEGSVDVRYSRSGSDLILRGHARAKLQAPCVRCNGPSLLDLDAEISLLLVPASEKRADFARGKAGAKGAKPNDEYEVQTGDADLDVYSGDEVFLDAFVREALLLEAPSFPLCNENCQGIAPPPEPATERGPDPRLAPLLKFKKSN